MAALKMTRDDRDACDVSGCSGVLCVGMQKYVIVWSQADSVGDEKTTGDRCWLGPDFREFFFEICVVVAKRRNSREICGSGGETPAALTPVQRAPDWLSDKGWERGEWQMHGVSDADGHTDPV